MNQGTKLLHARMDRLATLARKLLPTMFDASSGLFAHKAVCVADGRRALGANALYSAMSAIGIHNDDAGSTVPVGLDVTANTLAGSCRGMSSSTGLVAATTWALAVAEDNRTRPALGALERGFNPIRSSSMDLGLVLSGLAAVIDAFPGLRAQAARVAALATQELVQRFSDVAQLFRGSSWALRPRRLLQWNLTSFASQVYPIHGLAQYARASARPPPQQIQRAAERLIATQGQLGQWWWIYSMRTGAVLEGYPVYSVHQDAMAFMALASLENLGLGSYRDELVRGLSWIFGKNELRTPLVDFDRGFISRCIQRRGADADGILGMSGEQWKRVVRSSWGLQHPVATTHEPDELEILEETRPYHLGWLLYARSLIRDW